MPKYFEFEVSLRGVKPRIWRRFLLPVQSTTFHQLHEAIQDACGWWNYHLFVFRHSGRNLEPIAGMPGDLDEDIYDEPLKDARRVKVNSFFGEGQGSSCIYEYDFGDGWEHEVKLVGEVDDPEAFRRRLLGGERAFPHEDSGGLSGYERYAEFVQTGKDPWEEDPDEIREWLGGWHPERFDLKTVKAQFDREGARQKRQSVRRKVT
jgi:hypothetical protein